MFIAVKTVVGGTKIRPLNKFFQIILIGIDRPGYTSTQYSSILSHFTVTRGDLTGQPIRFQRAEKTAQGS